MPKEQKHDTFSALFAFRQHKRAEHNTARLIGARTALEFNPKKRLNAALSAQKSARLKKTALTDFGLYRPMGVRPRRHIFLPLQTCERTSGTKKTFCLCRPAGVRQKPPPLSLLTCRSTPKQKSTLFCSAAGSLTILYHILSDFGRGAAIKLSRLR